MSTPPHWDECTSQTFTLPDGRTLGFAEFGYKDGHPIFDLHGLPGSRHEGKLFESAALEHNARIISVDRPGIGLSSPQPGRTALDHAKDIQAVAKHLKIDTFSVMGVSGGGPYALACAHVIPPSQLRSVALVAGCAVYNAETARTMFAANSWMFWALKTVPWMTYVPIRLIFMPMLWPTDEEWQAKTMKNLAEQPASKDKTALDDDNGAMHWILMAEIREHFRQGYGAYTQDGNIIASELGFDLVEVPQDEVALWYGRQDTNVPAAIGEEYARKLKSKAKLRIEDETHLSLVKNWSGEIIKALIERAR